MFSCIIGLQKISIGKFILSIFHLSVLASFKLLYTTQSKGDICYLLYSYSQLPKCRGYAQCVLVSNILRYKCRETSRIFEKSSYGTLDPKGKSTALEPTAFDLPSLLFKYQEQIGRPESTLSTLTLQKLWVERELKGHLRLTFTIHHHPLLFIYHQGPQSPYLCIRDFTAYHKSK